MGGFAAGRGLVRTTPIRASFDDTPKLPRQRILDVCGVFFVMVSVASVAQHFQVT